MSSPKIYVAPKTIATRGDTKYNTPISRYMESLYPSLANLHLHPKNVGKDYSSRSGRPIMHSHGDVSRIYMDESEGYKVNEGTHMPYEIKMSFKEKLNCN